MGNCVFKQDDISNDPQMDSTVYDINCNNTELSNKESVKMTENLTKKSQ